MAYRLLSSKSLAIFFVPLFPFFFVYSACAADLKNAEKALNIISDFADKLCQSPPLQGTTQGVELSGKAKAELDEVVRKIVDLGIEGAGKYQSSQYQGVLQNDLANLLKESTQCRREVWKDLKDKLIPLSKPQASPATKKPRGSLIVNDVIVQKSKNRAAREVDFRVTNIGGAVASISRVRFKLIAWHWKPDYRNSYIPPSQAYDLDISDLSGQGEEVEVPVSHEVKAGDTDRFIVTLAANTRGQIHSWTLKPQLVTSSGIVAVKPILIELP